MYTAPSGKTYIGKTLERREARRKYEHAYDASKGSNTTFHKAIRKYGIDSFEYTVLMRGIPSIIAGGLEAIYISLHTPEYNITKGGEGVDSETARKTAISRWADPKDRAKRVTSMQGKKKTITEAFKRAQSVRSLGKPNKWNTIEYTCPHCAKVGKGPNMKRYHFDNCKTTGDSNASEERIIR